MKNARKYIFGALLLCGSMGLSAQQPLLDGFAYGKELAPAGNEWEQPTKLSLNKEQPHTWFFTFSDVERARRLLPQISSASVLNPSAVEVVFSNHQRMTLDFYGENIFRMFQDNMGGIVRDPQASPEARILVDRPRKEVGELSLTDKDGVITVSTARIQVELDKQTSLFKITDKIRQKVVVESVRPVDFMEKQVLMSNANLGCIDRIERICHAGQELVEIDDHIRPAFHNSLFEETDTTQIGRDAEHIISHATRQRVSFVGRSREEVRTLKAFNRRMDMTTEEIRNLARETFSHQHFHHFVPITP